MEKKVKFKGLWTPNYVAVDLLFPKPKSIDHAEMRLKAWAHDIIDENKPNELIAKAEEMAKEYASILKVFNYERKLKGDDEMDYQTLAEFDKLLNDFKGA